MIAKFDVDKLGQLEKKSNAIVSFVSFPSNEEQNTNTSLDKVLIVFRKMKSKF